MRKAHIIAIDELQDKSIVLAGDTLFDAVYLTQIAAVLKAFDATGMINKVDYIHLQALHGGLLPDDEGVAGIDADVKYQNEIAQENLRYIRKALNPSAFLTEPVASITLVYSLLEDGVFDLYEFGNQYIDGICFLQTGDPDRPDPRSRENVFYGEGSLVSDILIGTKEHSYWQKTFSNLQTEYGQNLLNSSLLVTQIWTRVCAVGRCARTGEPFLAYNPWTIKWLTKSGLGKYSGQPVAQSYPVLSDTITSKASTLSVRDVLRFINNSLTQSLIREAVDRARLSAQMDARVNREDWLLLALNLVAGLIPGLGQMVTICSHLYQRARSRSK